MVVGQNAGTLGSLCTLSHSWYSWMFLPPVKWGLLKIPFGRKSPSLLIYRTPPLKFNCRPPWAYKKYFSWGGISTPKKNLQVGWSHASIRENEHIACFQEPFKSGSPYRNIYTHDLVLHPWSHEADVFGYFWYLTSHQAILGFLHF